MEILYPNARFHRITEISPDFLLERGIEGVILDVDNTLTTHDNPVPAEGVLNWLEDAKAAGLRLLILSNNRPERVLPFAGLLGLEFQANGKKPLRSGYLRACKKLKLPPKKVASIGDQLFTDVLGARLCGIFSIFVDPIEPEQTRFFRLKRKFERPILAQFDRRKP